MQVNSAALRNWIIFVFALMLIVAGFRGRLGSMIGALLVPYDMSEVSNS